MVAPRRSSSFNSRNRRRSNPREPNPLARFFSLSALCLLALTAGAGCALKELTSGVNMAAALDLNEISIVAANPIRTGEEVTFVVNFTNRAEEDLQFHCKIEPGGQEAVMTAPALAEDSDVELEWPTLPAGKHKIMCGAAGELQKANIFSLTKEFSVVGAKAKSAGTLSSGDNGFSIVRIAVTENQRTWSGKLLVRVRFENPGEKGGWLRCATSPASQGGQYAQITRERQGFRIFEFVYPENLSAEYTVMCAAHKSFADGPIFKEKSFYVGL